MTTIEVGVFLGILGMVLRFARRLRARRGPLDRALGIIGGSMLATGAALVGVTVLLIVLALSHLPLGR